MYRRYINKFIYLSIYLTALTLDRCRQPTSSGGATYFRVQTEWRGMASAERQAILGQLSLHPSGVAKSSTSVEAFAGIIAGMSPLPGDR